MSPMTLYYKVGNLIYSLFRGFSLFDLRNCLEHIVIEFV